MWNRRAWLGCLASSASGLLHAQPSPAQEGLSLACEDAFALLRTAGKDWLAGELQVRCVAAVPIELRELLVHGPAGEPPLVSLEGTQLLAACADERGKPLAGLTLAPGQGITIFLWHALAREGALPRQAQLALAAPPSQSPTTRTLPIRAEAPVQLQPPLRGGPWVAVYDPAFAFGHRRAGFAQEGRRFIPARFAIDWIRLDRDGRPASREGFQSWHGLGEEVLAVADGRVVAMRRSHDDVLDRPLPVAPWQPDDVAGNFVCLQIAPERFVFYEHLQKGSITVEIGQSLRAGQPLARVGRSGVNSSGPHLHMHVADRANLLHAQGRPFGLSGFGVLGAYPSMAAAESGRPWVPVDAPNTSRREMPAPNNVVMFD